MNKMKTFIYFCEPDESEGHVIRKVTKEDAINAQRKACIHARGVDYYDSDEEALKDFIAIHWAWEAPANSQISRKETLMKIVYIAGPYRAANAWEVEKNIRRAEEAAYDVGSHGLVPQCPHTMYRHFDGTMNDEFWLEGTLELMRRADAVFVVEGWRNSTGTLGEIKEAYRLNIPVFFLDKGQTPADIVQELAKKEKEMVSYKNKEE